MSNDDDESVVASNRTEKEKSQVEEPTAAENNRTGMELEESPIYMDVHLNILPYRARNTL